MELLPPKLVAVCPNGGSTEHCWGFCMKSEMLHKFQMPHHHANFWLVVVNTSVIRLHYQLPLCRVLVSVYLRLYLVVLCLCVCFVLLRSCLTVGDRKVPHYQLFLTCKYFHRWGFLDIWTIILWVPPWNECWEPLAYVVNKCWEVLPLEVYASISFSSRITYWWQCFEYKLFQLHTVTFGEQIKYMQPDFVVNVLTSWRFVIYSTKFRHTWLKTWMSMTMDFLYGGYTVF